SMPLEPDHHAARAVLGLPPEARVLALLPGSRLGEIARLGADFIGAARLLSQRVPGLRIVAPMANAECRDAFAALAGGAGPALRALPWQPGETAPSGPDVLVLSERSRIADGQARPLSQLAMAAADAVLLASGAATLEALLAKRPMVVGYR